MSDVPTKERIPLATLLFRREALVFLITLVCSLIIFIFSLRLIFSTTWDQATQAVRIELEREADTIARLLVFEFSHLTELETQTNSDSAFDEIVKRRLWEKVTFNETIRGIELIHRQSDPQGQHLTYSYFPLTQREPESERGPQKALKSFSGPEGELIRLINREQRVDRNLLESINQGRKQESELLLRYFPLYIPLPDQGAAYWGVTKVGINADAMRRFLVLLEDEKAALRQTLAWIMGGMTAFALALGLLGFQRMSRKTAALLSDYGIMNTALESGVGVDIESLLAHLNQQESQNVVEFETLQNFSRRLGETIKLLGERLIDSERQACSGRLLARLMQTRVGQEGPDPGLKDWANLFTPLSDEWRAVYLEPYFQQISSFLTVVLPAGSSLIEAREPIQPLYGSEGNLVQAVLFLMDFVLLEMQPGTPLHWRVFSRKTGGVDLELSFAGRNFHQEEINRLLQPFKAGAEVLPPLGPFLASAIADQHGGTLVIQPNPEGGLHLRLEMPDSQAVIKDRVRVEKSRG
jgi:hypothetical protein